MILSSLKRVFAAYRWLREAFPIISGLVFGIGLVTLLFNIQGRIVIESTDAFTYADTARQIAAGQGIATAILQPEVTTPTMPQTTWPPFFPLLIAIPLLFGASLTQALLSTPVVFLALSAAVFVWYIVRRWGMLAGLLWALVVLTAPPLLHVAAQPLTEAVFMGLSLLIVIVTFELLEGATGRRLVALSILTGLALAAAGLTRYLGFALAPGVFLALLVRRRLPALVVTAISFTLVALPLLIRNFVVYHQFTNQRFPSDRGFFLNVQDGFLSMGKDFLHFLIWPRFLAIIVIALLTVVLVKVRPRPGRLPAAAFRFGLVSGGLGLVYLFGMIGARSFVYFDKLYSRFVVPTEWLILAGICVVSGALLRRVRALSYAVGVVVVLLGIRFVPSLHQPPTHARLPIPGTLNNWASQHTEPDALIVSNHGHSYNFFLGRSTVVLRLYRAPKTVEELKAWGERWRGQFPSVYLILSRDLSDERHTPVIVRLSNSQEVPDFLEQLPGAPSSVAAYRFR